MGEPFKNLIDRAVVTALADTLLASATRRRAAFDRAAFVRTATRGLVDLELLDRGRHVAAAMREHLPQDLGRALAIVVEALDPRHDPDPDAPAGGFLWLPFSAFIEAHGTAAWETGIAACLALTKRFTAEWCIRPFLELRPAETLALLHGWARDPNEHVRRLCSEGTRTRLPWGRRLPGFIADPDGVFALLAELVDDPSEYVRRSVANNLNDLAKDHPTRVLAFCRPLWRADQPARRRLVTHALRTLIKRGDRDALALVGADVEGADEHVDVSGTVSPKKVAIGGRTIATVRVLNRGPRDVQLVVDLVVHYVKANGTSSPKVFKGKRVTLAPGGRAEITKPIVFVDRSIRRHFVGKHRVDAKVNGRVVELGTVVLTA